MREVVATPRNNRLEQRQVRAGRKQRRSQLNWWRSTDHLAIRMNRQLTLLAVLIAMSILSCVSVRQVRVNPITSCAGGDMPGLTVNVVDQTGSYLPGATVTLIDPASGGVERIDANRQGVVTFARLPRAGICTVRAELPGFEVTVAKSFACPPQCHTAVTLPMGVDMRNAVTFT